MDLDKGSGQKVKRKKGLIADRVLAVLEELLNYFPIPEQYSTSILPPLSII